MILTIISYPSKLERIFEEATLHFAKLASPDFAVERCQDHDELVWLARLWKRRDQRITRLDLFGHGGGGRFALGDDVLFASDGTGYRVAKQLGPQLAPDAHLRLLGCRVARNDVVRKLDGRRLLRDLAVELGRERVVWGTTAFLGERHLGPTGFTGLERMLVRAGPYA